MPVSVHKILIHGAAAATSVLLSIGIMSEEAQETSNKLYWRVRERHKNSRVNTTADLIHTMLQMSDLVISNIRSPKFINKRLTRGCASTSYNWSRRRKRKLWRRKWK